ncbi:MAG: carbohydrate porin [Candidatus Omnitrophica bacterium]|nr:carbohydrate porin [Candidatus Omnitrophota bacterium]MBU4589664.1 carbohydrate porin [Candidatus Omnitrophota bacterium]
MFRKVLMFAACILLLSGQVIFAEVSDDDILGEIRTLREQIRNQEERINELEQRLAEKEATPTVQLTDGTVEDLTRLALGCLNIKAGATFVVQGTDNANGDGLSQKGEDVTDASYSINLMFEKEFEDYGKAFIGIETGDGAGVEDELRVFSNVNRDADDSDSSLAVAEAWYEHAFQSIPASLMAGKIDGTILVDTNEYANDECTQFLGRIFRNSPTIEIPDNTAGLRLNLEPGDIVDIQLLMMDGDNDWEDIADDGFYAAQLNLKPGIFDRSGNYRFLGWLSDREHTKWNDSIRTKEEMYGFGISFDQELSDSVGAFLRYGWQDPDVYLNDESFSLEHAWSAGLQFTGSGWGREGDIFGIAVGQAIPSDKYKDAGSNLNAEDEGHFEAYYNYKVNDHLTMTPDVQIIWNPYGDDASNGNDTITVVGMKGQVDF